MKRLLFGVLTGFLLILTGCLEDDGYSLGDQWIGFGVVENIDNLRFRMDNGDILKPVTFNNYYFKTRDGLDVGDRVYLNFTILDDTENDTTDVVTYYVQINSLDEILLKQIINVTPENEDSIGNDPIIVRDVWIANNMINFQLKYWGRYETHFINLVKQPGELNAEDQPFQLELRHNKNDDDEDIPYSASVSFHLDSLIVSGLDSVRFDVTCEDYNGVPFLYEGSYVYGNAD